MRQARCCLVLLGVTLATAAALRLLVPGLVVPDPGFEGLLVAGCAAVAAACALWGWLGTVAVVVEALRCRADTPPRPTPGVPAAVRRAVLAACGVALCATAGPALAAPGVTGAAGTDTQQGLPALVAGLPLPTRAMDLPATTRTTVVVRPGDSLWAIAAARLPAAASDAEIEAGWRELYAGNRAVVGDDPSLIHPGQRLTLPRRLEER
jgi:nucleoid-associated protein YgaU